MCVVGAAFQEAEVTLGARPPCWGLSLGLGGGDRAVFIFCQLPWDWNCCLSPSKAAP